MLRSSHAARERIWEAIARQDLGGLNKRKRQENAPKNLTERQKNMVAAERQKLPLPALLPSQELRLLEAYVFCHIYKAAKESPHLAKWATTMKLRPHEPNASYFVDPDGSAHGLPAGLVTADAPLADTPFVAQVGTPSSLTAEPPPASHRGPIRALSSAHTSSSRPTAAAAAAAATASRS